ncbi:MAG TPA: hypothetical protein VF369_06025 [candidate division Zixibacteria bacterium]
MSAKLDPVLREVEEGEEEEEGTGGEVAVVDQDVAAAAVAAGDLDKKYIIGNRGMNRLVHTAVFSQLIIYAKNYCPV